jgi:hypothetical protein
MTNILRQHFPMLREREDILGEINADKKLSETFYQWTKKQQEDFLDSRAHALKSRFAR